MLSTQILDISDPRWFEFTKSNCQANIFHHPVWAMSLAECYGHRPFVFAVAQSNGEIVAGIPMLEVRNRLTGWRWVSLPYSDHCIPLYRDTAGLMALLEGLTTSIEGQQIELRWDIGGCAGTFPSSEYILSTVPLHPDDKIVFNNIHHSHQRNIRTAEKNGLRIHFGTTLDDVEHYYRLHVNTRRRQGMPVQPLKFFEIIGRNLIEQGLGFVLLAYKGTTCLAGALFLQWHNTLTYKYGASLVDSWNLKPNNLLFWTAIRYGCENGYAMFDMGRTEASNTGLQIFKQRWGATEIPLRYTALSHSRPKPANHERLINLMQLIIRNSPPIVSKMAGSILYRYFA